MKINKQSINKYYNRLHELGQRGVKHEGAISLPLHHLLVEYAESKKYTFAAQITIKSKKTKKNIRPDGILMNELRIHRGYWESKDTQDDLDKAIESKIHNDGYPTLNTLFEDSQTAVLIQEGKEVMRKNMQNPKELHEILLAFISYRPLEVEEFEEALERFKQDIPAIVTTFRTLFDEQSNINPAYVEARKKFLKLCKKQINPEITTLDIREMLIQHILTEELFTTIFDDASFLSYNVIAKELEVLIATVLTREVRQNQLGEIRHYYQTINKTASAIADHQEKQKFLKVVYENFYKVYNPKGADRLGVVYTPNEIVRFMIESTDYLLDKHFDKTLSDEGVDILDPATGTGTFITDLIDYLNPHKLPQKYKTEIHANEVSILPYYIANLNIEYTYKHKMGKYVEFPNICFVDTLDNVAALDYPGKQKMLFGVSSENAERIKSQNKRKISVIIGNPPYNANQQNFNDFNKNREYPAVDQRIKTTFVKHSTAQKSKVYDMYARFYRWAIDRLSSNGVIAFITNRSFIDSRTFDGFRKVIADHFQYAYIVDTKSDVRANPKIAGTTHNVFGIQTGVAIMFLIKKENPAKEKCQLQYFTLTDEQLKEDKLAFFQQNSIQSIPFERLRPDKKHNWINLTDNDFKDLLPLVDKQVKLGRSEKAVFKLFSTGILTAKDEWVYDFSAKQLGKKVTFFIKEFNKVSSRKKPKANNIIKWTSELLKHATSKQLLSFDKRNIKPVNFRAFTTKQCYYSDYIIHRFSQNRKLFPIDLNVDTLSIAFACISSNNQLAVLASNKVVDLGFLKRGNGGTFCISFYRYDENGKRYENITNWGLQQFQRHYKNINITKFDVFYYTYAILYNPAYRKKYEFDLRRDFPRLPFYKDFEKWVAWGKELIALHRDYETIEPYQLTILQSENQKDKPKAKLKADKEEGVIILDENTKLTGIPSGAWAYKLGNRSALEWILDQYKEKKPRDKTIAEKFNTYRFSDYKEQVIDLLKRVCMVSVRTMEMIGKMGEVKR